MIIKSMARKQPSFGQLIAYMNKDSDQTGDTLFSRNLYANSMNSNAVEREFLKNHKLLAKHSNRNSLYHELITLEQNPKLSHKNANQILKDLAEKYLAERSPDNIVFGRIHHNRAHPHIHLMISSNAVRSNKRTRIGRARFSQIQVNVENYKIHKYPNLDQHRTYQSHSTSEVPKLSNREAEQILRTGKLSAKQKLAQTMRTAFSQTQSMDELSAKLKAEGFRLYKRGKHMGLEPIGEGRRIRLKTLGLENSLQRFLQRANTTKPEPQLDDRAKLLLRHRKGLEQEAENHLQEYEGEQS